MGQSTSDTTIEDILGNTFQEFFPDRKENDQYFEFFKNAIETEQEIPQINTDYLSNTGKDVLTKERAIKLAQFSLHKYFKDVRKNEKEVTDDIRFYLESAGEQELGLRATHFVQAAYQCHVRHKCGEISKIVNSDKEEQEIKDKMSKFYSQGPEEVRDYILTLFLQDESTRA